MEKDLVTYLLGAGVLVIGMLSVLRATFFTVEWSPAFMPGSRSSTVWSAASTCAFSSWMSRSKRRQKTMCLSVWWSRSNAILIPHSPGNLSTLTEQMRNVMMEADQTGRATDMNLKSTTGETRHG